MTRVTLRAKAHAARFGGGLGPHSAGQRHARGGGTLRAPDQQVRRVGRPAQSRPNHEVASPPSRDIHVPPLFRSQPILARPQVRQNFRFGRPANERALFLSPASKMGLDNALGRWTRISRSNFIASEPLALLYFILRAGLCLATNVRDEKVVNGSRPHELKFE